ncbi:MAG TPA: hypothetical protein VNM46_07475 [Xanthobacteraceae bacterium]|jgi:hypothetical protein|nr:hypothetical protein [Xanthobacteraceae bacterium]
MPGFEEWESFYVIVGAAAGALIGLQFVVMTLLAERRTSATGGATYATPQIVHFSAALFLCALVRAPWHGIAPAAVLWGLTGLCGFVYELIIARRMSRWSTYRPAFEDWFFHVALPLSAYALLAVSGVAAFSHAAEAQFALGAATLMLLFAGIHNAWDAVTWHLMVRETRASAEKEEKSP